MDAYRNARAGYDQQLFAFRNQDAVRSGRYGTFAPGGGGRGGHRRGGRPGRRDAQPDRPGGGEATLGAQEAHPPVRVREGGTRDGVPEPPRALRPREPARQEDPGLRDGAVEDAPGLRRDARPGRRGGTPPPGHGKGRRGAPEGGRRVRRGRRRRRGRHEGGVGRDPRPDREGRRGGRERQDAGHLQPARAHRERRRRRRHGDVVGEREGHTVELPRGAPDPLRPPPASVVPKHVHRPGRRVRHRPVRLLGHHVARDGPARHDRVARPGRVRPRPAPERGPPPLRRDRAGARPERRAPAPDRRRARAERQHGGARAAPPVRDGGGPRPSQRDDGGERGADPQREAGEGEGRRGGRGGRAPEASGRATTTTSRPGRTTGTPTRAPRGRTRAWECARGWRSPWGEGTGRGTGTTTDRTGGATGGGRRRGGVGPGRVEEAPRVGRRGGGGDGLSQEEEGSVRE
ncbi:hypothetical protein THAOC_24989 [Thalassiosira oceanica]|uniref:Uncharacterized protein n=1 Tax=Thalassiosira oceanica TaxID=159749 RepID=K0S2S0_THAOC|nr:hypothetical protein THAOC_24989 [Thalassiosira oceanica]|eukprot:EJK55291.1 hypothetical protein THAOC_24989 [Thalassiosira oceanica]